MVAYFDARRLGMLGYDRATIEMLRRAQELATWSEITGDGKPEDDATQGAPPLQNLIPAGYGEFEIVPLTDLTAIGGATLQLDTSQKFMGKQSLKVTGPTTNGATWGVKLCPTVGTTEVDNTYIRANRRFLTICAIRPGSADSVGNDVAYYAGFQNGTNTIVASSEKNFSSSGSWNYTAFQVDMTAESYQSGKTLIQVTNQSVRSTAPYFWLDCQQFVDVTDSTWITETSFPSALLPSSGPRDDYLSAYRFTSADQDATTDSSLKDDAYLKGWSLQAASAYAVEVFLMVSGASSGDMQWQFTFSQTPVLARGIWQYEGNAVAATVQVVDFTANNQQPTDGTSDDSIVMVRMTGVIQTHATADGTMKFQWAQNSSSGTRTRLHKGSWVSVIRMGAVS